MGSELAVAFGSQGLMDHDAHAAVINQIGKDEFDQFDPQAEK